MPRKVPGELIIYIYDMDYIEKGEPNFLAMRVSSFHKQLGDYVVLMEERDKFPKKFKHLYIFNRAATIKKPPITLLYNEAVSVYGLEFFNNWTPSRTVLACRPDYSLYPRGRDKFERSDAIQLTDEQGHLLPLRQNDKNIETDKDSVITDENFWKLSNSDLLQALNSLKIRKNIYFLYPIPLSRVLDDSLVTEAFLDLRFAQTVRLQWENPFPFTDVNIAKVLGFFDRFKESHEHIAIGKISFYPKTKSDTDRVCIVRAFKFIMQLKKRQMQIELRQLHNRLDSVYAHAYYLLSCWSERPHLSWMENIAMRATKLLNVSPEEYYCHSEWWSDELFRAGVDLMLVLNDELSVIDPDWMLWQYADHYYPRININWKALLTKELWY